MPPAAAPPPALGRLVLPGDFVCSLPPPGAPPLRLGASVAQSGDAVFALRVGVLRVAPGGKLWLAGTPSDTYGPALDDAVLGVVLDARADGFRVELGAPWPAFLPALAFEKATRRNRPPLRPGSLVFARVTSAPRDGEAELSCTDAAGAAAGFGPLTGGWDFRVSCRAARALLAGPVKHAALDVLGGALPFELAVGVNGRVWADAGSPRATILVSTTLQKTALMRPEEARAEAKAALKRHAAG